MTHSAASSMFPDVLLNCIREGRSPMAHEVNLVAQAIWRDGLSRMHRCCPGDEIGLAHLALTGDERPSVATDMGTGPRSRRRLAR
jgi:hypothetical protein